ncbi:MAG: GTPase HflX [Clostridia bacterium]|nr:GTPase HflX [Clostridia bacterium]
MILNFFDRNKAVTEGSPAVLVSVVTDADDSHEAELSLAELRRLCETAGAFPAAEVIQNRHSPDARTVIGSGKLGELSDICRRLGAALVVFDCELTPSQIRNIEDGLGEVSVIDRSMLILDIFALHAVTAEGKLQVELAQLKYTAPRLIGRGSELSRLGGGIGTRGPGESQLETDRRHIQRRIRSLSEQLASIGTNRATARTARERSGIPRIAIVGYTNAGKSTLLNRLTDAGILAEDKLFATLDPTTRKYVLPDGREVLLTDTVGFIRNLPTHLIKAFSSTLEEAVLCDLLLIMVDASDPDAESQLEITKSLLAELGAADKPRITIFNKCDLLEGGISAADAIFAGEGRDTVFISASGGEGVDSLLSLISEHLDRSSREISFLIPNAKSGLVNLIYESGRVLSVEYGPESVRVDAVCDSRLAGKLAAYAVPRGGSGTHNDVSEAGR